MFRHRGRRGRSLHCHAHVGLWGVGGQPAFTNRFHLFEGVNSGQDVVFQFLVDISLLLEERLEL